MLVTDTTHNYHEKMISFFSKLAKLSSLQIVCQWYYCR